MRDAQSIVQSLLDQLVFSGAERGLQFAAYRNGELLVNASAGVANHSNGEKVDENTLFPVFSTTKGIAATVIHRLAERGLLSYDEPIATLWPEFAAQGKESITLRQALNHSCGLPNMPKGIGYRDMCDWKRMCSYIAEMKPLWPPGTRMEYHAITYSWTIGEVACRATGLSFPELVQVEICAPLGLKTMFVGLPAGLEPKVAILEEYGPDPVPPPDGQTQPVPYWLGPLHTMMNRSDARRACIPASNGIMNALAIARHYAALLPGGLNGVELLPPERVRLATEPQRLAFPENEDYCKTWGLGYKLGEPGSAYGETARAFGHSGYGGSLGFADPESGLAVGFTKNLYQDQPTARTLLDALRAELKE